VDLADSYVALGDTLRKQGTAARAGADYRKAQSIAESVSASDPNDQRAKEELVDVYCGLGESLRQQDNLSPAIDLGNRAVKIATELVGADPVNAHSKAQLARAYFLLGDAYQAKGIEAGRRHQPQSSELKKGLSSYQKGLEIYTGLHQSRSLPYSETAELSRVPREITRCEAVLRKTQSSVAAATR
jgi:tetratricopeptide (TPR) repeat protein